MSAPGTPAGRRPISSPDDQSATFVELFFDLVFVFSVTQVVGLLHDGLRWSTVGQAVLVFWLVWWAWTQFTWSLNAADTTHPAVELATLVATAVAFFLAVALPEAFGERTLWFALSYVAVRAIGLTLYGWVAWEDTGQRAAVRIFTLVSLFGLGAVLVGGIAGGSAQYWFWGLAIALDVIAAAIGGQVEGWNLHPEHFTERHGLFVIIALGESLIVAASGVTGASWTVDLVAIAVLAVVITCALWWSYFPRAKPVLEHAVASRRGAEQSMLARDAFSLLHFPMLCGVIAFSFVIEEVVAHPGEPLSLATRIALALGLALFVGGMAAAVWRATGRVLLARVGLILATGVGILLAAGGGTLPPLAIAAVGVLLVAVVEERTGGPLAHATP